MADLSQMFIGVLVDRDMMMQAAINLLSNAVKYTDNGGCVTLRSRLADQSAIFEVHDNGVGLSEEDKQRVFEKFYRVKKDREMAQGTGLGLPLAKHIVEDVHGGRLDRGEPIGRREHIQRGAAGCRADGVSRLNMSSRRKKESRAHIVTTQQQ